MASVFVLLLLIVTFVYNGSNGQSYINCGGNCGPCNGLSGADECYLDCSGKFTLERISTIN